MLKEAYEIACSELRKCYSNYGILAGLDHFNDYWARDGFFSLFGANRLKDFSQSKKQLELFLSYMKENGQLPMRIGQYNIILKLIGIKFKTKIKAKYCEDKVGNITTDQNSLFIIGVLDYVKLSKDIDFAKKNFEKFVKIIEWNFSNDKDDDLIMEENDYAGWADSIRKNGKVFYTNVLFYGALKSMAEISKIVHKGNYYGKYLELSYKLGKKLNELFWNGLYYTDWINNERHEYFSMAENLFAIIYGLADKNKAMKIISNIEKFKMNEYVPSKVVYPDHKNKEISLIIKLFNEDYHSYEMSWLWVGCLDVIARYRLSMKKEALDILDKIAEIIVRYGKVYEVYKNKKPYKAIFYKAEQPFAWSSGLFIYACNEIKWKN